MDVKKKIKIIEEISVITNKLNELEKLLLNEEKPIETTIVSKRAGKPSINNRPNTANLRWVKSLRTPFN